MENKFTTENLNVGDKVIVKCSDGWSSATYIGIIKKKTPTGLVDVSYGSGAINRFRSTGSCYEKRERYSRGYTVLENYTEEKEKEIQEQKEMRAMRN